MMTYLIHTPSTIVYILLILAAMSFSLAAVIKQINQRKEEEALKNSTHFEIDASSFLKDISPPKPGDIVLPQGPILISPIENDDPTDIEIEIAGILDRLGIEMLAASRRLRTAPYSEVEDFVKRAKRTLERVDIAATTMKSGCYNTALEFCRLIEVPEIDFTDADEDEPARVSSFFETGS